MNELVVDIETVGEQWKDVDEQTQHILHERIARFHPDYTEEQVQEIANSELAFTPLTGVIVAIGVLDCETEKGAVYFLAKDGGVGESEKDGIKYRPFETEKELLERFWELTTKYTTFVTFNGRTFDMPYIMLRSAINGVKPKKDLMRGRYLYQQSPSAIHIDLYDQLNFYGSFQRLGGLHLACRAFKIETPKDGEIDGSKVSEYFYSKKYLEIAEYNGRDLIATKSLYAYWKKYLSF